MGQGDRHDPFFSQWITRPLEEYAHYTTNPRRLFRETWRGGGGGGKMLI